MHTNTRSNLILLALALASVSIYAVVMSAQPINKQIQADHVPEPEVTELADKSVPSSEPEVALAASVSIVLPAPPAPSRAASAGPKTVLPPVPAPPPAPPSTPPERKSAPVLEAMRESKPAPVPVPTVEMKALLPSQLAPSPSVNALSAQEPKPTPIAAVPARRALEHSEPDDSEAKEMRPVNAMEPPSTRPSPTSVFETASMKPATPESPMAIERRNNPKSRPLSPAVEVTLGDRQAPASRSGWALLRVLELGSGPEINIAWPDLRLRRNALYAAMTVCYGVKTALLDTRGRLFLSGEPGPWKPNTDYYSGFMREVTGELSSRERDRARAIRTRHPSAAGASVVRLFPREVDSVLLGGLKRLLADGYADKNHIRAARLCV